MRIPIINGIYVDNSSEFSVFYPKNLIPIVKSTGISEGYLRHVFGIDKFGDSEFVGVDRGAIDWNGIHYRVIDGNLVSVSNNGDINVIGYVGGVGQVSLDYSFDYLGIVSGGNFFLYDGTTIAQVTDPDLGYVISHRWVDGYFMLTDGEFLIVTELNNPFTIDPLKYGSSEVDPDPVKRILKVEDEIMAINRYTTETFNNVGGDNFPFQRNNGALITKGCVGTNACCEVSGGIIIIGGDRNEGVSVWLLSSGNYQNISTQDIDKELSKYSDAELSDILLERLYYNNQDLILIHLNDRTLVLNFSASRLLNNNIWFILSGGIDGYSKYPMKNFVRSYNKWIAGSKDIGNIGVMNDSSSLMFGEPVGWEFNTGIIYNDARGAVFNSLELVAATGNQDTDTEQTVWQSYSYDGVTWSQEKPRTVKRVGNRNNRLIWFNLGIMRLSRIQKFRGTSDDKLTIAALEANMEPLMA